MIYQASFEQISEIYSALAKFNLKIEALANAEAAYRAASDKYAESGYTATDGADMCDKYDMMEKAKRGAKKMCKTICELFQCDRNNIDEWEMIRIVESKCFTERQATHFLAIAEYQAVKIHSHRKQYA